MFHFISFALSTVIFLDAVRVSETKMPALQLFNFLWTHEDLYKMEVFCMHPENDFSTVSIAEIKKENENFQQLFVTYIKICRTTSTCWHS